MKEKIAQLLELQRQNLIYSDWIKTLSLEERFKEMRVEVKEAREELENKNWESFKDEMGDVLWDCLGVIAHAERDGHLTAEDLLQHVYNKFTERKPFLLEKRHIKQEEEWKIWKEVKAKQKNAKNNTT